MVARLRHGWITRDFANGMEGEAEGYPAIEIMDGGTDEPNHRTVGISHDELRNLLRDLPKMMPVI